MTIKESIAIRSEIQTVWENFTEIPRWRDWNTVMKDVCTGEDLLSERCGLTCVFSPFLLPLEMDVTIERMITHERIEWSAKRRGLSAWHTFLFVEEKGGVRVISEEKFSGLLTRMPGFHLAVGRIRGLTKRFLRDLKKASER